MKLPARFKTSLKASIKEGVAAQIMTGMFDYYLIPFALYLKVTNPQIGLLVSIPPLLASFSQLLTARTMRWAGGAKKLLRIGTFIQAVLLLPIGFLIYFKSSHGLLWLIVFVAIFRILNNILGPAWGGLVSRYLPENLRGEYFGRRCQLIAIAGLVNLYVCGIFLAWMKHFSLAAGFMLIFLAAAIARFISFYYMGTLVEIKIPESHEDRFTFWMFISRFRESNFVKFILYVAGITFATQLSGAYFNVYMLQDLKFNYVQYMLVNLSSVLGGLLVLSVWGRHADVVGNVKILKTTGALLPISPLLWCLAHQHWQLMLNEAFSGFIWGGFNLCTANFIYDAVSPSKRVRCIGYFNLINGVAIFAGAALGGYLTKVLPPLNGSPLITLFLISAFIRILVHVVISGHFNEVRSSVTPVHSAKLFLSVLGVRPFIGRNVEWTIFPLKWNPFRK